MDQGNVGAVLPLLPFNMHAVWKCRNFPLTSLFQLANLYASTDVWIKWSLCVIMIEIQILKAVLIENYLIP